MKDMITKISNHYQQNTTAIKRVAYIDQLKGLAMLMVVVSHLLQYTLVGVLGGVIR